MLPRPRYWQTTFGNWVRAYGPNSLAADLKITPHAIYNWIEGSRTPHSGRAIAMVRLSAGSMAGPISMEDIYRHRSEVGAAGGDAEPA